MFWQTLDVQKISDLKPAFDYEDPAQIGSNKLSR
jgi:hypothetical protein